MGMKIDEAIKALENIVEYWTYRPTEREAAQMAIAALREQQERMRGCEYCKGGGNAKNLIDGETTVFITAADEVFCADWGGDGYLDWKYCPMCGRKLGEADG